MTRLSLSGRKIFNRLIDIITVAVGIILVCCVISGFDPNRIDYELIYLLVGIAILPSAILFIEYLNVTLKLQKVEFTMTDIKVFYKNGEIDYHTYDDLEVIKLYKSAGMDKKSFTLNIMENYYYAKIVTKDGKKIILTSVLGPDLSDALNSVKNVPIDRVKTAYAFFL
ncbi:MAG: hypothetical protein JWQ79_2372 [Mucilaginibacter sp.]|nr:hypothetical protein [Mucilaginibacter sp.]